MAESADRITEAQKDIFVNQEQVPDELQVQVDDQLYGEKQVLFRRESKNVRLTIFEGGHEIIYPAAMNF